ncbi:MAG: leucine zipper domain-containing protein [Vicinamibacterales bacterium]
MADGFGVSIHTVAKWMRRFRTQGVAGPEDGSSRSRVPAHQTRRWQSALIRWLRGQHGRAGRNYRLAGDLVRPRLHWRRHV